MAEPWQQLEDEPPEAYARFLVYRNLGPARTLEAAYRAHAAGKKRGKQVGRSGQWEEDSRTYDWRRRAAKWDIAQLANVVPEATGLIFEAIAEYARRVLAILKAGKLEPQTWEELRESLIVLAGFVSPEVIAAAVDHSGAVVSASDDDQGGGSAA